MRVPPLLLLLAGLLAACAAPPPEPPIDGPAVWRQTIAVAEREWQRFGGQIVRYETDAAGGRRTVIDPVRTWEDDRGAYDALVGYWAAVGEDPTSFDSWSGCYARWERKCPWQLPWSAAFVSYVMREAGLPRGLFEPNANHWVYVRQSIWRAARPGAVFQPEPVEHYAPQPGDLICKTRAGVAAPAFDAVLRDPYLLRGLPMHCDIVVANDGAPDGIIEGIGGNVLNSVSKSLIPARDGRLVGGLAGRWFIILRNVHATPPAA